jgi:hypothetical protein
MITIIVITTFNYNKYQDLIDSQTQYPTQPPPQDQTRQFTRDSVTLNFRILVFPGRI